jgi:hypothetical protein
MAEECVRQGISDLVFKPYGKIRELYLSQTSPALMIHLSQLAVLIALKV